MNVKIIKTEDDYQAAMSRLLELMSLDLQPGSTDEIEFELLSLVIEAFEKKTVPSAKADPIEAILFCMDQMNLSRKDLIPYLGSISKVSEVLSRKRPLSLPMIRRLNQNLGIPADLLIQDIEIESSVIESDTGIDFTKFPLKEMFDRGYFKSFKGNSKQLKDYAEDVLRKFMHNIVSKQKMAAFFRAPMHQRGDRQANEIALRAWQICVLKKSRDSTLSREYKDGCINIDLMRELAKLSAFAEGPKLAKEYLNRYGISFIIENHFNRTFLDGAAIWDNGRPIVALTLRHDRLDNFWFALMHELAHVALHLTAEKPIFTDDLDRGQSERIEAEADVMAQEALIPSEQWRAAKVRETLSAEDAVAFAEEIGIHPAIVAGRLRYEQNNYRLLSHLIGKTGQVSQVLG